MAAAAMPLTRSLVGAGDVVQPLREAVVRRQPAQQALELRRGCRQRLLAQDACNQAQQPGGGKAQVAAEEVGGVEPLQRLHLVLFGARFEVERGWWNEVEATIIDRRVDGALSIVVSTDAMCACTACM